MSQNATMRVILHTDLGTENIYKLNREDNTTSPKLFILALEDIFKSPDWKSQGISIIEKIYIILGLRSTCY